MSTEIEQQPAVGGSPPLAWYALKPLKWKKGLRAWWCETVVGNYCVEEKSGGWGVFVTFDESPHRHVVKTGAQTLKEAKAYAWDDYIELLQPALERVEHTVEVTHSAKQPKP